MNLRKRIALLFSLLLVIIGLTVGVTYAWYSFSQSTPNFIITSGTIKLDAKVYIEDQDLNPRNDGTYDANTKWRHIYSPYEFTNCIPGETFVFKLEVRNVGTLDGNLNINLHGIEMTGAEVSKIRNVLNLYYQNTANQEFILKNFSDDTFFHNEGIDGNDVFSCSLLSNYDLKRETSANEEDFLVFYFKIQILGDATTNDTLTGYKVTISNLYVELNQKH